MRIKSLLRILGLLVIALGVWYFFIKGYNYKISFTIKQSQGIIYDHLSHWNDGKSKSDSVVFNVKKEPFSKVIQHYRFGDSLFKFDWDLKMIDENTTKVTARTKDEHHSILQNLFVLSPKNHFKKTSIASVKKFRDGLIKNVENYRLHDIRDSIIPPQHYAYISIKSRLSEKASMMQKNIFYIMNYIKAHDTIQLTGHPFLQVTEWNVENDSLAFDFCFPINKMDTYPDAPSNVTIKQIAERKALKLKFNGNYRISDRAWYQLRDYARYHNIKTTNLPVEIFHNDPHSGTNSLEWVAEVFMPLE